MSKKGNIIGVKKREKNTVNVSSPVKFKMGIRYYLKQELCRENSLIKVLATLKSLMFNIANSN